MPNSPIILTALKNLKSIRKFVLPSHHSETDFRYKNLVIVQVGPTAFIMFIFCLFFFRIMVVEKNFDVAMSTIKLSLGTAYNQFSVLFYV